MAATMQVRKEQMRALSVHRMESFVARMARHLWTRLRKQCEAQGLKQPDVEPMVRQGILDAAHYGITYEEDVRAYLECMAILGRDFDRDERHPWAGDTLRRDDLSAAEKLEAMDEHILLEGDWEEDPQ